MTVADQCCDVCGRVLAGLSDATDGPEAGPHLGVRFTYHPGDVAMQDTSGTLCHPCWAEWVSWLGDPRPSSCSVCGTEAGRWQALHLSRTGGPQRWRLCARHAAELLNRLRTVQPKFDPATFRLPFADRQP